MCRCDGRQAMLEPGNIEQSKVVDRRRDRSRGVVTSPWQFDKRTCRIACAAAIAATYKEKNRP
jgi:hypothetical protein